MDENYYKVLIVGDGNFSFSLAYYHHYYQNRKNNQKIPELHLYATSFDSYEQVIEKYAESELLLQKLIQLDHVSIIHSIDATKLHEYSKEKNGQLYGIRFDLILFNHPHTGVEDVKRHQILLSHFFYSSKQVINETNGKIEVSLASDQCERWQIVERAEKLKLDLVEKKIFNEDLYPGYERRRHQNGKSFHQVLLHGKKIVQSSQQFVFQMFSFDNKSSITKKDSLISSSVKSTFDCAICLKTFSSSQGLKTHTHMIHNPKGKSRETKSCSICLRLFVDDEALNQHLISKHGQDTQISPDWIKKENLNSSKTKYCSICNFYFNDENTYMQHLKDLQPQAIQIISCPKCDRNFSQHRAFRQHANFCKV